MDEKVKIRIEKKVQARIPTGDGEFWLHLYVNDQDEKEHLALVLGEVQDQPAVLVRVHSECFTGDVLGSRRCDCGEQLQQAMQMIAGAGQGVLIYLRQEGRGIGLLDKLRAYNLQDQGYDTVEANLALGHQADERDYTIAARILEDLGVHSVQLLTNNPLKIKHLKNLGIPVTRRVPLEATVTAENAGYLFTKAHRMNHLLSLEPLEISAARMGMATGTAPAEAIAAELHSLWSTSSRLPVVTLSYAQSLDGCIAARRGERYALSGPESKRLTHQLRASHEAILVGIGTVLADDPRLTVRLSGGESPQVVVLDSQLRIPLQARLLQTGSPWIAATPSADLERCAGLERAGARVLTLPAGANGQVDLKALLARLADLEVSSLMVEGGARVIGSFLREQLVDFIVLTIAPLYLGGLPAVENCRGSALPRLENPCYAVFGEDLVAWGRPVWQETGIEPEG